MENERDIMHLQPPVQSQKPEWLNEYEAQSIFLRSHEQKEFSADFVKFRAECPIVKKSADNPYFKSKYADQAAIDEVVTPVLSAHGFEISHEVITVPSGIFLHSTITHAPSGQWRRCVRELNPVADGKGFVSPQALGSAETYGVRYNTLKLCAIATENEDDDGNAASQGNGYQKNTAPAKAQKSPFQSAAQRNQFCKNVTKSFEDAATLDELNELAALNKQKFGEMDAGTETDIMAVQELRKQFKTAKGRIETAEIMRQHEEEMNQQMDMQMEKERQDSVEGETVEDYLNDDLPDNMK